MDDNSVEIYLTRALHQALNRYKREASQREYEEQASILIDKMRAYQYAFKDIPAGVERARAIHRVIDASIKHQANKTPKEFKKISCNAGCSGCCYMRVEVTRDEVTLLKAVVAEKGIEIDQELIQHQANLSSDKKSPREFHRCVFLSKAGRCRVYEDRPINCRKYFVKSQPASCLPTPSGKTQEVTIFYVDEAEVIASAAIDLSRPPTTIAEGLVQPSTCNESPHAAS